MLFTMRLPRTEVTLVYYKREKCRLSVKRRRSSQNSAGYTNKDARLWPASVPVGRGLKCVEHAEYIGCIMVRKWRVFVPVWRGIKCVKRAKRKLYMRSTKNAHVLSNASVIFLLLFFWCFFVCIRSGFRCICFGSRRFSLYVCFGNWSSSCFLIHNRLLY